MIIILLGPPGSGKGTQANKIKDTLKIAHISTGEILREYIKKDNPIGQQARQYVESGALVPDDIIIKIIGERIKEPDCKTGFLLDGFPRTINQAKALDDIFKQGKGRIDKVINLVIPDKILVERISGRRTCRKCGTNYHIKYNTSKKEGICDKCGGELYQRKDDSSETVKQRLEVYHKQTAPLLDYYAATVESRPNRDKEVVININGDESIEKVSNRILRDLE